MKSLIRTLDNPKTQEYFEFKNNVFQKYFSWYSAESTPNSPDSTIFYSHSIVERPTECCLTPRITSNYFDTVGSILKDIITVNNLSVNCFLRINVNRTFNYGGGVACKTHIDHDFPHKNLLIYLNTTKGATVVINSKDKTEESFHPKEDNVILFEGEHYHYQPDIGEQRTVLIATFI